MVRVVGTSGADQLAGLKQADVIGGGGGADTLFGWDGDDRMYGGAGADLLIDGFGLDKMTGGGGRDTFRLSRDGIRDVITDFLAGVDRLDVSALGARSMDDITMRTVTAGLLVNAKGEKTLLKGVDISDMGADSFKFTTGARINFDDLSSDSYFGVVGANQTVYKNVLWENFGFVETDEDPDQSGFIATSGNNVAYNIGSNTGTISRPDGSVFDLESAMMSSAWRLDLNLAVTAYLGKTNVGTQFFVLNPDEAVQLDFNDAIFDHVTRVEFTTFGGTETDTTTFNSRQFSMDDLFLL
jgi:hypothetical protein